MIIDPIGDLITRIRNGQMRGTAKILAPNSRLRTRLLDVLQAEVRRLWGSEETLQRLGDYVESLRRRD